MPRVFLFTSSVFFQILRDSDDVLSFLVQKSSFAKAFMSPTVNCGRKLSRQHHSFLLTDVGKGLQTQLEFGVVPLPGSVMSFEMVPQIISTFSVLRGDSLSRGRDNCLSTSASLILNLVRSSGVSPASGALRWGSPLGKLVASSMIFSSNCTTHLATTLSCFSFIQESMRRDGR